MRASWGSWKSRSLRLLRGAEGGSSKGVGRKLLPRNPSEERPDVEVLYAVRSGSSSHDVHVVEACSLAQRNADQPPSIFRAALEKHSSVGAREAR